MDAAIETLSTTSEHSVASSSESTAAMQSSKRSSHSPSNYGSNHTGSTGGSISGNRPSSAIGMQQHQHQPHHHMVSGGGGNGNQTSNGGGGHHRHSISPTSSSPPPPIPLSHRGGNGGGHPPSPPSSAAALSHQQMMQQMQHQLSPPHVTTPNSLSAQMGPRGIPHLPPHSLGLLNSLQMMHHASPLELMAAAHHHVPPRSYNSPPPISTSDPSANECKLVEYRGQKVAAFIISGDTMLCLPQAFELFLKHLVGGLHTVYTKLKRLDIVPLVCNVEQVRILRGLGAIQPGVNRCKLLSCKDFDILYRDCTTARCLSIKPPESSRPGRPPKRGPVGLSLPPTHLSGHPQLKKHRLDNGDYAYENGHINDISRLDKSPLLANGYNPPPINHMAFMQMNHHPGAALLSPGMPPHGLHRPDSSMMKAAAQAAGGMSAAAGMDAIARSGIWENCRAAYEDIVKHLERNYRLREERTDDGRPPLMDQKPRDLSSRNGSPGRQSPVLNLSKSGVGPEDNLSNLGDVSDRSDIAHSPPPSVREENDNLSDENVTDDEARHDKEEDLSDTEERDLSQPPSSISTPVVPVTASVNSAEQAAAVAAAAAAAAAHHQRAINYSTLAATAVAAAAASGSSNVPSSPHDTGHSDHQQNCTTAAAAASSTETLLRNIQSLLKVAADNARQQERQITYEKAELKMDVLREREVKDSLERQLVEERKLRVLYQKRYRRERKMRIRLQQQIEGKRKPLHPDEQFKGLPESGKNNGQDIDNKNITKSEKLPLSSSSDRNHRRSPESPSVSSYNTRNEPNSIEHSSEATGGSGNGNGGGGGGSGRSASERIGSGIEREGANHTPSSTAAAATITTAPLPLQQQQQQQTSIPGGPVDGIIGSGGGGGGGGPGGNINAKGWSYPGIDLMATGAFWQNYSESLAQEIEMERKARQQNSERDVKSPLQERQQAYYKNSVLFGSAT